MSNQAELALTPLRAHYLKRAIVTLEFVKELAALDSPTALAKLGRPFLPSAAFDATGHPLPAAQLAIAATNESESEDLPFLKFAFHHFVLTFPFLAGSPPTFFSHKLQPFVNSFLARNISKGGGIEAEFGLEDDDAEQGEDARESKRSKLAGKFEKQLGLIMSAAIRLSDNNSEEEVVRISSSGDVVSGLPASKESSMPLLPSRTSAVESPKAAPKKEPEFDLNVVSVRTIKSATERRNLMMRTVRGTKTHEEFIVRTRRTGQPDIFVARRYGDFTRLAENLRKECLEEHVPTPPAKDRRKTDFAGASSAQGSAESPAIPSSPLASSPSGSTTSLPSAVPGAFTEKSYTEKLSAAGTAGVSLSRERNRLTLRAYLRSLLHHPTLASHALFAGFLLDNPITLTPTEIDDIRRREELDRVREEERLRFKSELAGRVSELESAMRQFKEEMVKKDGLTRVFGMIRTTPDVRNLPPEYQQVIEWARISLASVLYSLFLGSDNSSSIFLQLKSIHGMMPYFMLRQILRISNPVAMIRAFLDLFLAKPFGAKSPSLLQRMLGSGLTTEAKEMREDAELVQGKIANDEMCQKVEEFVNASRDHQVACRAQAIAENVDIMAVILRSSSPTSPPLSSRDLHQVAISQVAYTEYKHHRDALSDSDDDEGPDNDDGWLFEDLHVYRRIITRARDKEQMVELLFEGSTSELLKDIVTIFYEPLAKVYRAANIADSLSDLQAFITDLIKTVELAEDANFTDPQRTVQTFVDLVGRHEARFYHFVHQVHSKGQGLFDSLMKWMELFLNFIRDGLPSPISLEMLLPHGGTERKEVMDEVDLIVDYHRKLKQAHFDRMRRRMVKNEAEGLEDELTEDQKQERAFVKNVMQNLNLGGVMGDVEEAANEDSEEDDDDDGQSSEEEFEDIPHGDKPLPGIPGQPPPPLLIPIRDEDGNQQKKRKKKKETIEYPRLVKIPQLVPVMVELVRGELEQARREAKREVEAISSHVR